MPMDEAAIWERLAKARRAPVEPTWLGEIYSPSLSSDLRRSICEKLGMLADRGWPVIDQLLQRHGDLPDWRHGRFARDIHALANGAQQSGLAGLKRSD